MAKGFSLESDPWVYRAKFSDDGIWREEYVEQPHLSPREEEALPDAEKSKLLLRRNNFADLPLVNYTTQYGMGCFEGLKAFPQPDATLKLFRPDENGKRMEASMKGLAMPPFPAQMFLGAVRTVVGKNQTIGFTPAYDPAWARDDFVSGSAVYIRPFTYAEPGIGVGTSKHPWVIVITTPVGSYFKPGNSKAITTRRVRANPGRHRLDKGGLQLRHERAGKTGGRGGRLHGGRLPRCPGAEVFRRRLLLQHLFPDEERNAGHSEPGGHHPPGDHPQERPSARS